MACSQLNVRTCRIATQLTASNEHGAHGPVAQSEPVVLGLPDEPTLLSGTNGINPGVGKLALAWTAPQTNDFIGTKWVARSGVGRARPARPACSPSCTCMPCDAMPHLALLLLPATSHTNCPTPAPCLLRYTLNLYRPSNLTAPVFTAVLSATGSTSQGVTTFTQELQVPAGPYQLEITTKNDNGDGAKTTLSDRFTVGVSTSASIVAGSGSTSGAELKVLRPTNVSDDAVATYLIQAYSDEKGDTKVSCCRLRSAAWGHAGLTRWQGRLGCRQWRVQACALPHSMLTGWRGGEGQQHGPQRRRVDAGHCLRLPLPRHRGRQAVVQGHGGGGRHAQ